jgi:carotenoid cleavage dioxygenase-like enzyme
MVVVASVCRNGNVSRLQWFEAPRCFTSHFSNAYDDGDFTIIDLPKHRAMFRTDQNGSDEGAPILVRWTLNRVTGRLSETVLDDRGNDFLRINGSFGGQPYRFIYTAHWGEHVLPAWTVGLLMHWWFVLGPGAGRSGAHWLNRQPIHQGEQHERR